MIDARSDTPLLIIGGTLAAVVTAVERARAGLCSTILNTGGPWGGYFAGVQAGGRLWDAGMVLYEFTSFRSDGSRPDVGGYDPMVRNDIGRFCATVNDFVDRYQHTHAISTPEMLIGRERRPDALLANDLSAVGLLPAADHIRSEIQARLQEGGAHSPRHPRYKNHWRIDGRHASGLDFDYDSASRHNHGAALHEALIQPFVRKVLGRDESGLAALYHRMAWLPLYWPETLARSLDAPDSPVLPVTTFTHPVGEPVAMLVQRLVAEMLASPRVTSLQTRVASLSKPGAHCFEAVLDTGTSVRAEQVVWAQSPAQGLAVTGGGASDAVDDRLPLMIGFLRLPAADVSTAWSVMHLLDDDIGLYRTTHVSGCAGELGRSHIDLSIEAHPAWFGRVHGPCETDLDVRQAVIRDLWRAGLVSENTQPEFFKLLRLPAALPLPTPSALQGFLADQHALRARLPAMQLIGPSAGPFANSLADQIVQGLAMAARTSSSAAASTDASAAAITASA